MNPQTSIPTPVDLACLAGLDEAGLGPVLGPLVVAGAALSGPRGADPWKLLQAHVSRDRHEKGRVRVADSKKVHQGVHGFARLEATVLTFWGAAHGRLPATLAEWLTALGVDVVRLQICPWYRDLALPLPHAQPRPGIELHAHLLRRAMDAAGVAITQFAARPVDVDEWNEWIDVTDNKSRAHFRAYAEVLELLLKGVPGGAHVVADRCGGIAHYVPSLRRAWPTAVVHVLEEGNAVSRYGIETRNGSVQVTFATGGEQRAFPTALSSCIAKYLRELMVLLLNRWFRDRLPGLVPTAGYYVDGHRFLTDVAPVVAAEGIPARILVRSR